MATRTTDHSMVLPPLGWILSGKTQNSAIWEGKLATQVIGEAVFVSESFQGNRWRLSTSPASAECHCWKAIKTVSLGEPDLVSIGSFKRIRNLVLMTAYSRVEAGWRRTWALTWRGVSRV